MSAARKKKTVKPAPAPEPERISYDQVERDYGPITEVPPEHWWDLSSYDPNCLITLIDSDDGSQTLYVAGYARVNRIEHYFTAKPMPAKWVEDRIILEDD